MLRFWALPSLRRVVTTRRGGSIGTLSMKPIATTLTKAVAYIRVSSAGQLEGDGPERQRSAIARFAATTNHSIVREFVEDLSGTKDAKSRTAFLELLDFCSTNNITTIIIEKTDRISRDMFVGLSIIGDCAAQQLRLIDADTGRDIANPTRPYEKFVVQVLMAAAELNKNLLVNNMAVARKRIRDSGQKCDGRKGYHDDPDFPEGPAIIARAQSLRRNHGHSFADIATIFNTESVPTINGGRWHSNTVRRMLKRAS